MMNDLMLRIGEIDKVHEVRKLEYTDAEAETIAAFIKELDYSPEVQHDVTRVLEWTYVEEEFWHIIDVGHFETVWVIEIAPVSMGDLPVDSRVDMEDLDVG